MTDYLTAQFYELSQMDTCQQAVAMLIPFLWFEEIDKPEKVVTKIQQLFYTFSYIHLIVVDRVFFFLYSRPFHPIIIEKLLTGL